MYGKHFESMYEGSMYGAGVAVFAVWGYVIAHARKARVELNPRKLSDTLGGTEAEIVEAIEVLKSPDLKSRHKASEGRRLVQEGEFQYFLPSWESYQGIRNADDRRAYNAAKQKEYRARKKTVVLEGAKAGGKQAIAEGLAEANAGESEKAKVFPPPPAPVHSEQGNMAPYIGGVTEPEPEQEDNNGEPRFDHSTR